MSEQPVSAPAARTPSQQAASGKRILGLPPVFFYGAVAGVAALVWMVYKSRSAKGTAAAGSGGQGAATGSCTDANGNPTPCEEMAGVDYSGQLSTEQTELEALLAQSSPPPTPAPAAPATPAAPAQVNKYPNVMFTAKPQNSTTLLVTFHALTSPTPLPTSYTVEAWQLNGKVAAQQTINAPDTSGGNGAVTLGGLHPTWCYKIRLWANGGKQAPDSYTPQVCMPNDGHLRR